jgi:hypothetical protein
MNYSLIIERAWKIIWKFKVLWIFGILASCSANRGGGSGGSNFRSSTGGNTSFGNNFASGVNQLPPQLRQFGLQMQHMATTGELWTWLIGIGIILALLIIVMSLLFMALGAIGQIGLIKGTWKAEEGAQKLTFTELFNEGKESLWKVILFKILLGVFNIALVIVFIILTIMTLGCGLIVLLPALIVGSYVLWVLIELIMPAMVGDDMAMMDAISKTWTLFKQNWVGSCLMGLLLSVINFVVSLVFAIPVILAFLPVIFGVISMTASHGGIEALMPSLIISGILVLIFIPIGIFLHGVLEAYLGTAWALTYRQLTGRPVAEPPTAEKPAVVDLPSPV